MYRTAFLTRCNIACAKTLLDCFPSVKPIPHCFPMQQRLCYSIGLPAFNLAPKTCLLVVLWPLSPALHACPQTWLLVLLWHNTFQHVTHCTAALGREDLCRHPSCGHVPGCADLASRPSRLPAPPLLRPGGLGGPGPVAPQHHQGHAAHCACFTTGNGPANYW